MQESYHYDCKNDKKQQKNINKSELDLSIDSIIKKEGYISCDVTKNSITTDGGNYMGNLFGINIKGKTKEGDKETSIFVKAMAPDAIDIELISQDNLYNKELFAYTELSKLFNELQDEAEVPKNEKFKIVKSYDECNPKTIILENLTSKGFKTCFRMDCLTLEMAVASVKELAKFHGLSFVIKDKRIEYFENKIKTLEQPFIFGTKAWEDFSNNLKQTTLKYLNEDMRRKIEDKITGMLQKYPQYLQDDGSKLCVCHGDYRPNNIMVKEENGKITEVVIIDYQLIHYGCSILDFFYLLYTGTDAAFRREHISYLQNFYYDSLAEYLQYFDVVAETVYPRKVFEKEFMEKRDYGLMVSVLYVPFIFVSEGEAPDISKDKLPDINFALDERYRDRIVGTFEEFIELGFL